MLIFVGQFEEYVRHQRGAAKLEQLGDDVNDVLRAISECKNFSFILTLHPIAQQVFEASAGPLIDSFGTIMENSATVGKFEPKHLIEMAKLYIKHFRTKDAPKNIGHTYPFEDDALKYIASKSDGIPRIFIRLLHNAMVEAILLDEDMITLKYVKQPAILSRIGITD